MISSKFQDKKWRDKQVWYKKGKQNECEKHQLKQIEEISKNKVRNTQKRLNIETLEFKDISKPNNQRNGFNWTENFDGYQTLGNLHVYYNLKMCVGSGGAQTRTLREVYHFITTQLKYIEKTNDNMLFINILDGDISFKNRDKFQYICEKYKKSSEKVKIMDMFEFEKYFNNNLSHLNLEKKELGQYFTTNYEYILKNFVIPSYVNSIVEPFTGNGDLLNFLDSSKKYEIECYDIAPRKEFIKKKDTLLDPPDYKNKFVITNPPFLARNKNKDKEIYDKYNENDLYKCFIKSIIQNKCLGGIIIIPLNFWCSIRKKDIQLRSSFLQLYDVLKINIFEEQVFDDTSYCICSLQFQNKNIEEIKTIATVYPSCKNINFVLDKSNNYTIAGHLYNLDISNDIKIERFTKNNKNDKNVSNIMLKCIDDNIDNKLGLKIVRDDERYIDETENLSARSYATLIIKPKLSLDKQQRIVDIFNSFMEQNRIKYNSLFLTNYRESNSIARKRISFNFAFRIVNHIIHKKLH